MSPEEENRALCIVRDSLASSVHTLDDENRRYRAKAHAFEQALETEQAECKRLRVLNETHKDLEVRRVRMIDTQGKELRANDVALGKLRAVLIEVAAIAFRLADAECDSGAEDAVRAAIEAVGLGELLTKKGPL